MPQRIKFWASESCTHTYFVSTIRSWPHCKLSIIIFLVDWFQYSVFSFDNNYLHLYFMLYNLIRVIVSLHTLSCTHHMWTKIVTSSHNLSSKTAMCIIDATQLIISSFCFTFKIPRRRRGQGVCLHCSKIELLALLKTYGSLCLEQLIGNKRSSFENQQ